ncbi:ComEA family DNA-binding protein [Actinobacillus equuli]|uniref:ComEA family DNA-binding protein n=1 Tax=Actinobacillus equuli TaxID=718 RepID=UPI0024429F59|nr:helix-hairpin-helix domain-containing protein [Actinobacillus equuli]WGE56864.1 helix-hairpin-helix domain-containing protein [Actinobacillus equuli subsp. equuli]
MKSLKTLLALGIAMTVSAASFAEVANPLTSVNDKAKSAVSNQVTQAKVSVASKAPTAKEALATAKTQVTDKVTATKENLAKAKASATDKVTNAKEALNTSKVSKANALDDVKASAKEKVRAVKTQAAEKTTVTAKTSAVKVPAAKKVNVNMADAKTLQTISGIGEVKAQAIIDYRNKVGKIKNAAELSNISGIGEATIQKVVPYLSF